ncbi:hypothetical protein Dsin_015494 [Dipteronia sinensis]|uniref:Reverse transcriptase zinc-binding domain-containing protein n=1 Tax=Dipteronia sinensis TaxID=43782 RepID=A0AAE0E613_9ROSI|nr:hypothetical protein Dsin_015494 [Dipteronia sinensis]
MEEVATSFIKLLKEKTADATVDQLITPSDGWDVGLVKRIFWEDDVNAILSIPLGRGRARDSLQWHFDQKGSYSVKSGYWVGVSLSSVSGPSNSSSFSDASIAWWKSLWKLQIPSKIKVFVWKACHNMLPSFEVLARRKILVDRRCPMCKSKSESIIHGLWSCSYLKVLRAFWFPQLSDNHKDKPIFLISCWTVSLA